MAGTIGTYSDFVIYNDEFWAGALGTIDENAQVFNAASANALRIVTQRSIGHYQRESMLDFLTSGVIEPRDPTATTAANDTPLTQSEHVRPKVNRRIGPLTQTLDAWKKIGDSAATMSFAVGQMVGQTLTQDYLSTIISSLVGALSIDTTTRLVLGNTWNTPDIFRQGLALMGDQAESVVAWVMHSGVAFQALGSAIAGGTASGGFQTLESVAGAAIVRGSLASMGRPVIITDNATLNTGGTAPNYRTLGLVANAGVVMESEERDLVTDIVTGLENLVMRIQGEYAFNVSVKGVSYDTVAGGANPSNATLAAAVNWDRIVPIKLGAGFMIETDVS